MAIAAFLPLAVFVLVLGSVGVRLTALWRRTGAAPEGLLGTGLLLVASSMPLTAAGRLPAIALAPSGRLCFAAGLFLLVVGLALAVAFHVRVFRPDDRTGRGMLAGFVIAQLGAVCWMAAANFAGESVEAIKLAMRPGTLTLMGALALAFAGGAFDSLRYAAALRRREALGLADPLLVDRFRLWGIAGVASTLLVLVIIGCVLAGMTIVREPLPLFAIAGAGLVMSTSWYLTFFAPDRYRRFVRGRAERA